MTKKYQMPKTKRQAVLGLLVLAKYRIGYRNKEDNEFIYNCIEVLKNDK